MVYARGEVNKIKSVEKRKIKIKGFRSFLDSIPF